MASGDNDLSGLEKLLHVTFRDRSTLVNALTHRSHAFERGELITNEKLEFIGDALLGFLTAEIILAQEALKSEGEMTKVKSKVVCEESLADLARRLELGRFLLLSRGEDKTGGRDKPSILADTFEAVLAAIYLDQGLEAARALVTREIGERIQSLSQPGLVEDPKSALQELCHQMGLGTPRYRLTNSSGPDHRPVFVVQCLVADRPSTQGSGNSKKDAERAAAQEALRSLRGEAP